jgi:ParB/RepB/Spo0J family partition protein
MGPADVTISQTPGAMVVKKQIERWPIKKLKAHPRQGDSYHNLSEDRLDELARDMSKNGQTTPIEVLPDGTILDGHQRLAAAKRLGLEKVRVWVRTDLTTTSQSERRLLEANLGRRHLDQLDQVRAAKRLLESSKRKAPGTLTDAEARELREALIARLGITGRHVRRLLNIASTPMPVQLAFQQGKLKLVSAEKVARLKPSVQERIAKAILSGEKPSVVVEQFLTPKSAVEAVNTGKEAGRLLDELATLLDRVSEQDLHIDRRATAKRDLDTLARFEEFAQKLRPCLERQAATPNAIQELRRSVSA